MPTASRVMSSWFFFFYFCFFAYNENCEHLECIPLISENKICLESDKSGLACDLLSVTKLVKFEYVLKQYAEQGQTTQ